MSPTLNVSEVFTSIQGEGASAGQPSTFLRLAGCNLRCSFCDTPYSWDFARYPKHEHVQRRTVADLAPELEDAERLVITGGEPLLQQPELEALLQALPERPHVEVETNGTIAPTDALRRRIDQWNVSPKLANADESEPRRLVASSIEALIATGRAWFKFVIVRHDDVAEVEALIQRFGLDRRRVLLQAEAKDRQSLRQSTPLVSALCREHSLGYSPRLHLELWDGARGR